MGKSKTNILPYLALICMEILTPPQQTHSAKIISVAFFSSKSHKIVYEPLLNELASRGHQVTVVSPVLGGQAIPNLREILTIDVEEGMRSMLNFFEMRERGEAISPFSMCMNRFQELCRRTYDLPQVKALLKEKFDLVLLQPIFNDCTSGFVYKLNTTLVLVSPFGVPASITSLFGNPSPLSFVPNMFSGLSDKMSLYERAVNVYTELSYAYRQFNFKPKLEAIYREKLNDFSIPSSDDVLRNASLILSNSHFSLNKPRPFLPDIVEVGGMHCRPAKPLPKDLEEFVQSSGSAGFIYFSMGSALKGSLWPEKYRVEFVKAFANLKQKVLWKWETETMADLPKNVKLAKWLPQQDILGHPKIKAFITHAGLGGIAEAAYHGVPLVGIPIFGDQHMNLNQAEINGVAVGLEFEELTEESILKGINKILLNSSYSINAKSLSKVYQDQSDKPLDRAVFWVEYVLRHKGALRLRSVARDLTFIEYYLIDLIAIFLGFIIFALLILYVLLRLILSIVGFVGRLFKKPQMTGKNMPKKKKN